MGLKDASSVKCYVDNKSLVDALHSTTSVEEKSLRINIAVLRDMMQRKGVIWVKTANQITNALTRRVTALKIFCVLLLQLINFITYLQ